MNSKTKFLLGIILMLVGGAIFLLPSDDKKIKKNLHSLAEYCSTLRVESMIETLRNVTLASKLCTDPCKIEIESRNFNKELSQKELSDNFLILKKRLPTTIFTFEDVSVDFPAENSASVLTTIRLNGESNDGNFTDAYEVDITVDKIDGDWLFSSFTVVEFMKK
ncbi:hypothetical protein [Desulforhopalus sp. 52FAK]